MTEPARGKATYEDVLAAPEHMIAELLTGELYLQPRPAIPHAAAASAISDWICEVMSSSTEKVDRAIKLPIYAREGVGHAWLVNPTLRTLGDFRLEHGRWLNLGTHRDDEELRAEPFDAIELELLWVGVRR